MSPIDDDVIGTIGQRLSFRFDDFTSRVTFEEAGRLRVEVTQGDGAGFTDQVAYELVKLTPTMIVLSWKEHVGSTVVHAIDTDAMATYCVVAAADGRFMRLRGAVDRSPSPAHSRPG